MHSAEKDLATACIFCVSYGLCRQSARLTRRFSTHHFSGRCTLLPRCLTRQPQQVQVAQHSRSRITPARHVVRVWRLGKVLPSFDPLRPAQLLSVIRWKRTLFLCRAAPHPGQCRSSRGSHRCGTPTARARVVTRIVSSRGWMGRVDLPTVTPFKQLLLRSCRGNLLSPRVPGSSRCEARSLFGGRGNLETLQTRFMRGSVTRQVATNGKTALREAGAKCGIGSISSTTYAKRGQRLVGAQGWERVESCPISVGGGKGAKTRIVPGRMGWSPVSSDVKLCSGGWSR